MRTIPAAAVAALLLAAPLSAQTPAPEGVTADRSVAAPGAGTLRSLTISRATGPIRLAGDLSDPGWEGASRATGFTEIQPREGAPAPVETEVLMTYDDTHLYVAFVARDPEPSQIRATLAQRDRMFNDDFVGIILDPRGDGALGYFLLANPLGVQGDMQATPNGEDASIDFVYRTVGRVTDEGYIVEMAIPFSSLRFPDRDVQSWRVTFVRSYPRSSRHQVSWAPLSQNNPCMLCQLGHLEGIEGIRAGGTLELLPALVASQSGRLADPADPNSFRDGRLSAEPSLGAKYVFRSGWMAEATLNPDFSQVESDAAQVDVNSTFALFYPERRPFFQEGMDLYEMGMNVFYSRSINAPQVAGKLSGRSGATTFGWIGARDEHTPFILPFRERSAVVQAGASVTNVLRARHNLYGDSYVGGLITDRRLDGGGSGSTASVDAMLRFGGSYRLSAHLVASHTREPNDSTLSASLPRLEFGGADRRHTAAFDGETYGGRAAALNLARDARVWSWNLGYVEVSPTYRADTGFQGRNDFRRASAWTGFTLFPERGPVERATFALSGAHRWSFTGDMMDRNVNPAIQLTLPRQTSVNLWSNWRDETFRGVRFDGLRFTGLRVGSQFSDAVRGGFEVGTGRSIARMFATPEVGSERSARVWATLKPFQKLVVEPSLNHARLERLDGEEIFSGYIARTRLSYQHNRELQLRVVMQYNDFSDRLDVEPLVVYQLNPFTMFYLGSTYGSTEFDDVGFRSTHRQYFAKFQYLFRR